MEQNSWKGKHKISRTSQNQHQLVTHRKLLSPYTAPRSALSRLCIPCVCFYLQHGRMWSTDEWSGKLRQTKRRLRNEPMPKTRKKRAPNTKIQCPCVFLHRGRLGATAENKIMKTQGGESGVYHLHQREGKKPSKKQKKIWLKRDFIARVKEDDESTLWKWPAALFRCQNQIHTRAEKRQREGAVPSFSGCVPPEWHAELDPGWPVRSSI